MRKIVLKNCDVKEFNSLIKRSASLDNYIFINIKGSRFESTAYNKNKSALKSITADLEKYCESYINELGEETVKIQFSNATKLVSALGLVGTDGIDVTFFIEENGYAKKVLVENIEINLTVPAADKEALGFLEIPDTARYKIFDDTSTLDYKVSINENEFKYLTQLFQLNKESCRVCFSITNDVVTVSEIESTDENVREIVNGYLTMSLPDRMSPRTSVTLTPSRNSMPRSSTMSHSRTRLMRVISVASTSHTLSGLIQMNTMTSSSTQIRSSSSLLMRREQRLMWFSPQFLSHKKQPISKNEKRGFISSLFYLRSLTSLTE